MTTTPDAAQAAAALARARAVHPELPERAPDEESRERMAELLEHARAAAAPAGNPVVGGLPERGPDAEPQAKDAGNPAAAEREPGCDDGDEEAPHPEVEERVQAPGRDEFTNLQSSQPASPLHAPHVCKRCSQPVYWAALLDEAGRRIPRDDGKGWKPICVDSQPDPDGTVLLAHRDGQGIVARVVRPGEQLPPGARLRRRHPYPNHHRRSR